MAKLKSEKYIVLPYFGMKSKNLQKDILSLHSSYQISSLHEPQDRARNIFSISSLFHFINRVPNCYRSAVCTRSTYFSLFLVREVVRRFHLRTYIHTSISLRAQRDLEDRTKSMLLSPKHSSIRDHSHFCDNPFSRSFYFDTEPFYSSFRLFESLGLYIHLAQVYAPPN